MDDGATVLGRTQTDQAMAIEYANIKYDMLMPVPKNCSMVEAAAIQKLLQPHILICLLRAKLKRGIPF